MTDAVIISFWGIIFTKRKKWSTTKATTPMPIRWGTAISRETSIVWEYR